MENNGWVKLHRKLLDSPIHNKPNHFTLWVSLLMMAAHKEHRFIWNGKEEVVREGQVYTGRKVLSEQTGIPQTTIEDILKTLENQHQIRQQKTTKYRLITIEKWKDYQNSDINSDNKATTKRQQSDTYNKVKNVNNEKNDGTTPSSIAKDFFNNLTSEYREKYFNILIEKGFSETLVKQEMLRFISYWTEPDKSGNKVRWEKQDVFEVGRRLATWFSKSKDFNKAKTITSI